MFLLFNNLDLTLFLILSAVLLYLLVKWQFDKKYDSIKSKILALKKYRDYEAIAMADCMNKNIKELELRIEALELVAGKYKDEPLAESEKLARKRELEIRKEKANEYKTAFKDWRIDEQGMVEQTLYTSFEEYYKVKISPTKYIDKSN